MEEVVVAWDDSAFADRIRKETGPEVRVATSRNSFNRLNKIAKKDPRLILLLELSWGGQRSNFHGFDVLRDLLMADSDRPILLCSFLEKQQFYSLEGIGRFLARMPFPFEQLPAPPRALLEKVRGVSAISSRMRAYIRENYLAQEPISEVVHDLRTALETELEEGEFRDTVARLTRDLRALNISLPQQVSEQNRTLRRQALRKEGDISDLRESTEALRDQLERHNFSRRSSESRNQDADSENYRLLVVEDDDSQREEYRTGLEPYFDEVRAVGTADEALDELRSSDEYRAVVADWRLLEDDGVTWQRLQGFDLLVKAWENSAPVHLVALTSLNREAVASVLRETTVDIDWFPKSEVGEDARWPYHAFADYIHNRVEPALQDLESLPNLKWWTEKGLGDRFLDIKYKSNRWHQVRSEAEKAAKKVIEEIKENGYLRGKINEKEYYKGEYVLDVPSEGPIKSDLQVEKVITQRLIVLAIHFYREEIGINFEESIENTPEGIYNLLRGDAKKDSKYMVKRWYPVLGLSRRRGAIKKEMFEHEKEWIRSEFKVGTDLSIEKKEEMKIRVSEAKYEVKDERFQPDTAREAVRELENITKKLGSEMRKRVKNILEEKRMRMVIEEYGDLEGIRGAVEASDPETASERLRALADKHPEAVAGNPEAPDDLLASLAEDEYGDDVHEALVDNPSTPDEVLPKLFEPDDPG